MNDETEIHDTLTNISEKGSLDVSQATQNLQAHLAAIAQSSPDAIISENAEGKIIFWNLGAEKMFGYSTVDVLGKSSAMLIPEGVVEKKAEELLTAGTSEYFSKRKTKDGKIIDVAIALNPFKDPAGKIIGVTFIIRGMHNEPHYSQYAHSLMGATSFPLLSIDRSGKITDANEATTKITGLPVEKLKGTDLIYYFTDEDKTKRAYTDVFEKGFASDVPLEIKQPDGKKLDVLFNASVFRDPEGNILGAFIAIRDITEKRKTEESLIKSRIKLYQFKKFFDLSFDLVCIANTKGFFEITSPSFSNVLGYNEEELLAKPFIEFIHPDDAPATKTELDKLKQGAVSVDFLSRIKCKDETYKYFQWVFTTDPVTGELFAVARDYTRQKKAEEEIHNLNENLEKNISELEIVNKELASFSYSVSHDLRASLRAINGFTQILNNQLKDRLTEDEKRQMQTVIVNSEKMGQLIDDLLAYSRLGKKEIQKENVDAKEMVESTVAELDKSEWNENAKIEVKELLPMYGDRALLHQVFFNLIANALKFSSKKPQPLIEIGSESKENENVYYVKDNGAGFDMQFYDKLFNVSQRLHSHEEFEGSGVGLAIANKIIQRHGGKIWAEAKVNEGATFYFSLPRK
jgi:PAS domain S-box-containing protein